MKKSFKKLIVAGLLFIGFSVYSQDASAAGAAKPSGVQKEAEFEVLGVSGESRTGGTIDNCGFFDGIQGNDLGPAVMYWYQESNYLEIDIKKDCNIWRTGTTSWPHHSATLKISKWDGEKYNDITSTVTQTTSQVTNVQWEKTISNLPAGRYRFSHGGALYRLDSEWYIESIENSTIDSNLLKVVLEPKEELQLSVDTDLTINTKLSWLSSDTAVATVDNNGIVTAVKAGNTVITVKSKDGSYQDKINVLVVDDADEYRLAVDLKVLGTCRLTIDDYTFSKKVTWSTMDTAVATISEKGKVTATGEGLTIATATDEQGNVVGKVYIRVRK